MIYLNLYMIYLIIYYLYFLKIPFILFIYYLYYYYCCAQKKIGLIHLQNLYLHQTPLNYLFVKIIIIHFFYQIINSFSFIIDYFSNFILMLNYFFVLAFVKGVIYFLIVFKLELSFYYRVFFRFLNVFNFVDVKNLLEALMCMIPSE